MKTLITLIFSLLFFCSSFTQVSWSYKGDYRQFHGIYDSNHYAVQNSSYQNEFTQDGGTTWNTSGASSSIMQPIVNLYYLSTSHVFAMVRNGSNFDFKESTDGGTTYTTKGQLLPNGFIPNSVFELYFFDQNNGLAISRSSVSGNVLDVMHRTSNGGTIWTYATQDSSLFDDYEHVNFFKSGLVRVYGNSSTYESKDKGLTWKNIGSNPLYSTGHFGGNGADKVFGAGWAGSTNPCVVKSIDSARTFTTWNGIPDTSSGGVILCVNGLSPVNLLYNKNNEMMVQGIRWIGRRTNVTIYSNDDGITWDEAIYGTGYETEFIRLADDEKTFVNYTYNAKLWILCNSQSTTGIIEQHVKSKVSIYPNPSQGMVTIENRDTDFNEAEVFSLTGKLMFSERLSTGKTTIDIRELKKGMYVVKLSNSTNHKVLPQMVKIIRQ